MNALQEFIAAQPCGFLAKEKMAALIALDRLCPVLVRCGCCRFTCPAQDVATLISYVETSKADYVRDVSFPAGAIERAAHWQPEPTWTPRQQPGSTKSDFVTATKLPFHLPFDESQCGGVFDGHNVTSDADSGL